MYTQNVIEIDELQFREKAVKFLFVQIYLRWDIQKWLIKLNYINRHDLETHMSRP